MTHLLLLEANDPGRFRFFYRMEKLPDSVWRALEYVETFGLMIRRGAQGNCTKNVFN